MAVGSNQGMGKRARRLLARKLKILRMMCGWSQEDLAGACGLHRTYISLIERTECNVSLDNLEKLAAAFGLSLPELFGVLDSAKFGERMLAMLDESLKRRKV